MDKVILRPKTISNSLNTRNLALTSFSLIAGDGYDTNPQGQILNSLYRGFMLMEDKQPKPHESS